jgi:hypothetical protein
MSERDEKRGGVGCAIAGIALILFFVLVEYLLGIGPAAVLAKGNPAAAQLLEVIYFPLGWLGQRCRPFEDVLAWYMELWTG